MRLQIIVSCVCFNVVMGLEADTMAMIADYFSYKHVRHVCYISCENRKNDLELAKLLMGRSIRVLVREEKQTEGLEAALAHWDKSMGVLVDSSCEHAGQILELCSRSDFFLFDAQHSWLVLAESNVGKDYENNNTTCMMDYVDKHFNKLNLSVDADIAVAFPKGNHYELLDVFNFGKIQGNHLEKNILGAWRRDNGEYFIKQSREKLSYSAPSFCFAIPGLNILLEGFKYYNRWDFHNLTLRAVSVTLERPNVFDPGMLEDVRYTPGVSAMTKIVAQLLSILRERHNFRFNYTIVGRWVGVPQKNSTMAVTNSLFFREQDISVTCLRMNPVWLHWADPFLPPATQLQTKCFYLIPERGVGEYENPFLTPLSAGVWACAGVAWLACAGVLACAAVCERRPRATSYAICSVIAAVCQQAYEDGVQYLEQSISTQSRRIALLVVSMTSMLLYNYYTSSVVSWLLNAAPPTISGMPGLLRSDLELVFEDIGYTHQWLDQEKGLNFYYSGFVNPDEDVLRRDKVTNARRTVPVYQSVSDGIELIRHGAYAYHTEPYTASREVSRRFTDRELCLLGAVQMMPPSHVYIMGQKRSPYKKFFTWSLMRLLERGHTQASRARFSGSVPPCSGRIPRALALGQAAPAFALLLEMCCLATLVLVCEIICHRVRWVRH